MSQDNWQIVAAHLGVLKAGGTFMFLDAALPDALISHMLKDARARGRPHAGSGPVPRPADPERHGATGEKVPASATGLAGRPHAAPGGDLLHERDHGDAQGRGVPARGLREPRAELRRLLRSPPWHGCDLAHVVAGLRRQHLGDVQRLGVGLRRRPADEGADPVRHGPRRRPPRSRGHGPLLSAGAAHDPHGNTGAGSPLSVVPLHRTGGRSVPDRARGAVDTGPTADHQHLRPHGSEHRYEPPELCGRENPSPSARHFPTSRT